MRRLFLAFFLLFSTQLALAQESTESIASPYDVLGNRLIGNLLLDLCRSKSATYEINKSAGSAFVIIKNKTDNSHYMLDTSSYDFPVLMNYTIYSIEELSSLKMHFSEKLGFVFEYKNIYAFNDCMMVELTDEGDRRKIYYTFDYDGQTSPGCPTPPRRKRE